MCNGTTHELAGRHLGAEHRDGAPACDVRSDRDEQRRLSHAGAAGNYDQVARIQAIRGGVKIWQADREATLATASAVEVVQQIGHEIASAHKALER